MQLVEVLEILHALPRADKFRAVQYLTAELAQEERQLLDSTAEYPVWSPYDATEAANVLTRVLRESASGA